MNVSVQKRPCCIHRVDIIYLSYNRFNCRSFTHVADNISLIKGECSAFVSLCLGETALSEDAAVHKMPILLFTIKQ